MEKDKGKEPTEEARPFSDWLQQHQGGATLKELDEAITTLTAKVIDHQKRGSLTLKVMIVPTGDEMVMVTDDVKLAAPEASRSVSVYFVDDKAALQRDNPRQQKLDLKEVPDHNHNNIRTIDNAR